MEHLRARSALDGQVKWRAAAALFAIWLTPALAWSHAGAFILAKCSTDVTGVVSLELTVDCGQHPSLTERAAAVAAMRQVLAIPSASGPVALDALARAVPEFSTGPDPDIPFPPDPMEPGRRHDLVKLRYAWQPGVPEIRFAVPAGNPHDVLFWLAGAARPDAMPVAWRILIAGDISPPVPVPMPSPVARLGTATRWALAAVLGLLLAGAVLWRRGASSGTDRRVRARL